MNLPNSLTILRIFFIPVLVVVLLTRAPNVVFFGVPINFSEWGVLILLAAAATDWADGFYARRRSEVTTLGILLDPIADKLLMSAAFISLVEMHLVLGWMAVIIIGREIVVLGLRNIASAEGFTIPASALGKTKMVLQVIAVCAVILARETRDHSTAWRRVIVAGCWKRHRFRVSIFSEILGPCRRQREAKTPLENSRTAQECSGCPDCPMTIGRSLIAIAQRAIAGAVFENRPSSRSSSITQSALS
jgi:CDP-diacylglycerol--glycerol-3-phosphate 3-phosphatidyltransferase